MVAFQNDTQTIESQIGPVPDHDSLKAAILSGKFANITPSGFWLVAWFADDEIEALEFAPVNYCKERWPATAEREGAVTIEVHPDGSCYVMLHPSTEDAS